MKIAIITGASSGLGREFVMQAAKKEPEIEEFWVIARRRSRLEELKEICPKPVFILAEDLTCEETFVRLKKILEERKPDIRLLINAAGFGKIGGYQEITPLESGKMIDLNCRAAVIITQLCLPYMSRGSRILMICSTAGFQPFPYLNVYAASKAFLYRYSRALRIELFSRRICVTAVCPYWIKDTEFIPAAKATDASRSIRHFPLSSSVRNVAAHALLDSRLGLSVSTPGIVCTVHRIAAKFIPSTFMMQIWQLIRHL